MDIVKLATDSGLLVVLDGMIGKTEYRSVQGSLAALERFADAVGKQFATHAHCAKRDAQPQRK
jgi:hypothetical protein